MNGLCVQGITKRFKEQTALEGVSLSFQPEKIYGLLGRNGAGKSTLLKIIRGQLFPDEGTVLLDGEQAQENDQAQQRIFLASEVNLYPESMRVEQAWRWTGQFIPTFRPKQAYELAQKFKLDTKKKIQKLSTGYRTIFQIITALAANAPYTLLDEPVLGLDVNHRELFYQEVLASYSENPRTIVISTHLIEEVAGLLEEVVLLKNGKVLCQKPAETLRQSGYTVTGAAALVEDYCRGKQVLGRTVLAGIQSAAILGAPDGVPAGLEIGTLNLQQLFLWLTKE